MIDPQIIALQAQYRARLLRSLHHTLLSPLGHITNLSEILLLGVDGPLTDRVRTDIEQISQEAEALQALLPLLSELLDADLSETKTQAVDLCEIMREVVASFHVTASETGAIYEAGAAYMAQADAELVKVTMTRLIRLAPFPSEGGNLRIWLTMWPDHQIISLSPDKEAQLTFDPAPLPDILLGDGISGELLLCQRLALLQGGMLWVSLDEKQNLFFHIALKSQPKK